MKISTLQAILLTVVLAMLCVSFQSVALSAEKKTIEYEDDDLLFRVYRRSPKQIAGFYEGRGFDHKAVNEIQKYCSIAFIVKNKSNDVLWLELNKWRFESKGETVIRITRPFWASLWQKINIPQSHRSTYGWTLMPEIRDLQKDEGVGGNVPLPMLTEPFTIIASFSTGQKKDGKIKTVTIKNVRCKTDEEKS